MLKTLSKSVKGYELPSILTVVFIVMETIIEAFIVFITSKLINIMNPPTVDEFGNALESIPVSDISQITPYAIALVVMAILSLTFGILNGIAGARASAGFAANLRKSVFHKIQDFSFENIDDFQTSSLITRLTTDISSLQMSYQMLLRITIRVPIQMISSIVAAFVINPELPWLFVIIVPVLGFALFAIIKYVMPIFIKLFKKYDKLNNSIQENVKGARVVKAYVREDYEIEKFNKASDELRNDFTKVEKVLVLNSPIMQACIQTTMLVLAYLSAKTICEHKEVFSGSFSTMQIGDYSALITYGVTMLSGVMMLSFIFVSFSMSIECARRVCEVLNTKSNLVNPENPVMEVRNGDIVFNNVSFKYKQSAENYALYDINLNIKSGSTVGILGGTGSSKTTLVNLISRLYDTSVGEIYVGGVNVKEYDLDTLRNNVAVVLQKNVLFSGSIAENLRWGNKEASIEEVMEAAKLAQAHDFITSFPDGYDTHIEQGGTNVSGGQKQRLCIARALLKKPKVLILDDSTSAVDTKTDAFIRKGLKDYIPETTKIIIAQRVASVMDADMIIVLENGTIDGIGTHEELLASNQIYQEVYYSQNRVGDE